MDLRTGNFASWTLPKFYSASFIPIATRGKRPTPTWPIFEHTELEVELTARLSYKLLGSIVADMENPSYEYSPEDVKRIIDSLVEAVRRGLAGLR
jgi:hypothetical protein